MATRTVWVPNNKGHNLDGAMKFGKVVLLTEGKVNIFNVDQYLSKFRSETANSTEDDFVLPCGSISLNMLLANVIMERHGKVNLLLFDLKRSEYVTRHYSKEDLSV